LNQWLSTLSESGVSGDGRVDQDFKQLLFPFHHLRQTPIPQAFFSRAVAGGRSEIAKN
jgi:hypothetical protein